MNAVLSLQLAVSSKDLISEVFSNLGNPIITWFWPQIGKQKQVFTCSVLFVILLFMQDKGRGLFLILPLSEKSALLLPISISLFLTLVFSLASIINQPVPYSQVWLGQKSNACHGNTWISYEQLDPTLCLVTSLADVYFHKERFPTLEHSTNRNLNS